MGEQLIERDYPIDTEEIQCDNNDYEEQITESIIEEPVIETQPEIQPLRNRIRQKREEPKPIQHSQPQFDQLKRNLVDRVAGRLINA